MQYNIRAIVGEWAIREEDGLLLRDSFLPVIRRGYSVTLDFQGVRGVRPNYFAAMLHELLQEFTPAELNRLLKIRNVPASAVSTLQYVIDRLKATPEK